ncbi:MAG: glycosyltransferase family 9 protein [Ginsengibacter sp.]|jgi:ADP-heptose:LPS heptosyltransferase
MKVLIIRFSSIGDIVLCTPVFRCFKNQIPYAEVHFLTKESFKIVTSSNPNIDKIFYYHKNINEIIEVLRKENYDYIIDLHKNLRSLKIVSSLKKKTYTIDKESTHKILLTKLKINLMRGVHITQRCLETVAPLGVKDDGLGLDYFIPEADRIKESDIPTSHTAGYIGLVIGASYYTKKLPVPQLQELCKKINYPIILLGGKEDRRAGLDVASVDTTKIYNACGKFNLNESADIVQRAKLIISHDTGLQYIACAFQKPILAIWGATSPKLDVEPYYGSIFMKQQTKPIYENIFLDLWCQPCSKYGSDRCPLGHFNCMKHQDIDGIVKKVNDRLGL